VTKQYATKGGTLTLTTDAPELEALLDKLGSAVIGHLRERGFDMTVSASEEEDASVRGQA
jgi:hypothetical protein